MNLCTAVSLLMVSTAMLVMDAKACSITNDGCSIPLSLPFPYKKDFTPACIKHDVCYRCVSLTSFEIERFFDCGAS